jgi:tetratricopeptide (TPR) repeat protein
MLVRNTRHKSTSHRTVLNRCFIFTSLITIFTLFFCLGHSQKALADVVTLKNGNTLEGRIIAEEENSVIINTGTTELAIPLSAVEKIEKSLPFDLIAQHAQKILDSGDNLLNNKQWDEARRIYESGLIYLEEELGEESELPEIITTLKKKFSAGKHKAVPPDPINQKAETIYQEALRALDHIDYKGAYKLLQEALAVKSDRADIQHRLGQVSIQLNEIRTAIDAYRMTLSLDPETYYREIASPLLKLLVTEGTRLANERQSDDAIGMFEEVLLLRDTNNNKAVTLQQFLSRQTTREQQSEDAVLLEVYKYADRNDLIDLAFYTIKKVAVLRPEDETVQALERENEFLSKLKEEVEAGNLDAAAQVMSEMPEDLPNPRKFARKIARITGEMQSEIDSNRTLIQAQRAFDKEQFEDASKYARKILTDFPESIAASKATSILSEAELEAPIKKELGIIRTQIKAQDYDQAKDGLNDLLAFEKVETSEQHKEIKKLINQIPREQEADRLYLLARDQLDSEYFVVTLETLRELASDYRDTISGQLGSRWLEEFQSRLDLEIDKERLIVENSIFAIANPNLWRAVRYTPSEQGMRVPKIQDSKRVEAMEIFQNLKEKEDTVHKESRSTLLYVGIPTLLGICILCLIFFTVAPPGKGRLKSVRKKKKKNLQGDPVTEDMATADPDSFTGNKTPTPDGSGSMEEVELLSGSMEAIELPGGPIDCRVCGMSIPIDAAMCPTCGATIQLSNVETHRDKATLQAADYNPWESRVAEISANDYVKYYIKAKELAETNDVQAAIENCRQALHEDPHQSDAYRLLSELFERTGKGKEAGECYHEIVLLEPNDIVNRQKAEAGRNLPSQPLEMNRLIVFLSLLTWWMVFWIIFGLETHLWWLRLILCLVGAGLMIGLWTFFQSNHRIEVRSTHRVEPDVHRPIPKERLSWKYVNRQAKHIADSISEHTFIEVPELHIWRFIGSLLLMAVFLIILITIAWVRQAPWALLAWPAGAVLIYYLLEIHPRALTAHVILRHLYAEMCSTWSDPHLPFHPKGKKKTIGEFLIKNAREFPLRWALNPFPYCKNRQGVLNSLQQTLNRHWACHRFYDQMHMVQSGQFAMPVGMKRLFVFILGIMILSVFAVGYYANDQYQQEKRFHESVLIGYQGILDGDLELARNHLQDALRIHNNRMVPNLYLAHTNDAAGLYPAADRSFQSAIHNNPGLAVPNNDYGNFLQRQGKLKAATIQYLEALNYEPENSNVLSNLGAAYFKMKDYEKAIVHLKKSVGLDQSNGRAYTTLGLAYDATGNKISAEAAYTQATQIAPDLAYTRIARNRLENNLDDTPTQLPTREDQTDFIEEMELAIDQPEESTTVEQQPGLVDPTDIPPSNLGAPYNQNGRSQK